MSSKQKEPLELSKVAHELNISTSNSANRLNAMSVRRVVERRRSVNEAKQITTAMATKIKNIPLMNHMHVKKKRLRIASENILNQCAHICLDHSWAGYVARN